MSNVELTAEDDDVSIEVTLKRIADELGEQYILNDEIDNPEFAYLAALALETHDNGGYSVEDTLMEFIRNTSELDVDATDCDKIETLLN